MFSQAYPSLAVSEVHLPCFLNNLSFIPAFAAAVVPPALKLCKPNFDLSKPIDPRSSNNSSLALLYDKGELPLNK
jgi:hypothetical protein